MFRAVYPGSRRAPETTGTQLPPPPPYLWRLRVPRDFYLRASSTMERDLRNQEIEAAWTSQLEALPDSELLANLPEVVFCGLFDRRERLKRAYDAEVAKRQLKSHATREAVSCQ